MKADAILDFLWPRRCEFCGGRSDRPRRHVCSECLMRVPFVPTDGCCAVCGRPCEGFAGIGGRAVCEECSGRRGAPHFDCAASAVRYEGTVREIIQGYKFNAHLWMRDDFTDWLEAAIRTRFDVARVDVVLPMPVSLFHRLDRGYSQCAYIAKELARRIDRIYRPGVVVRCGHPRRQAGLDELSRRENVKGTFAVRRPEFVRGRTVLVVDDVMTTGSTLSECARTLKESGAWRVWCATIARSVRDG